MQHLLQATRCAFWHEGVYTVQLGKDLASLTDGRVTGYCSFSRQLLMKVRCPGLLLLLGACCSRQWVLMHGNGC